MRILLTNDDGFESVGLAALASAFEKAHEVWIVAPDRERSGTSNSISFNEPIRVSERAARGYACSGTPADCVTIAVHGVLPEPPDVVVSGINIGPNLGTDVVYSGTCAAARQAAYKGIPGIAVSLASFRPTFHFSPVTSFLERNIETMLALWNPGHFVNVNAPNLPAPSGVQITVPAVRRYNDALRSCGVTSRDRFYMLDGALESAETVPGTDWHAVEQGAISVAPIELNPTNHVAEADYRAATFSVVQ